MEVNLGYIMEVRVNRTGLAAGHKGKEDIKNDP